MFEAFLAGGPIMWPILLCSILALATFFERLWSLRRGAVIPTALCVELLDLLRAGRFDDARTVCRARPVAVARVIEAGLEARTHGRDRAKERIEEAGRREAAELERFVAVLSTTANVAPLLGLLGTVGGIILTFQAVESGGMGRMEMVGGGIAQALNTTFAGLVVAIPAVVFERVILGRIAGLTLDLEEFASEALDLMGDEVKS